MRKREININEELGKNEEIENMEIQKFKIIFHRLIIGCILFGLSFIFAKLAGVCVRNDEFHLAIISAVLSLLFSATSGVYILSKLTNGLFGRILKQEKNKHK